MIIHRRMLMAGLLFVLLTLAAMLVHQAYAGKSTISLNSPVSFPVDI